MFNVFVRATWGNNFILLKILFSFYLHLGIKICNMLKYVSEFVVFLCPQESLFYVLNIILYIKSLKKWDCVRAYISVGNLFLEQEVKSTFILLTLTWQWACES